MKHLFLILLFCPCYLFCIAQLSPADTISDQRGLLIKEIPDGKWVTYYNNGQVQFLRTYSFEKWKQFQHEKHRYHPKRVSMQITKLYHDNRKQAEKYLNAINSFCAMQTCYAANETEPDHYHPPFENGLLNGPFANYFPDGMIKDTGNYKNGLPEGIWIKWTDDKQFYWKGFYKHGVKTNEWKLYSANEKLLTIVSFRQGKYLWRKDMKDNIEIAQDDLSGF